MNHSLFFLADDGVKDTFGSEMRLRQLFENALKKKQRSAGSVNMVVCYVNKEEGVEQ